MKTELEKRRRGIKMPHVYILLILVMALVVLSWVVPWRVCRVLDQIQVK